jgi:DNA-binding response OmpR family regulator
MIASRPLRILVVDDDPAMVGAITALVGTEGHQVITAYDGLTAVKRFREEAPDLVLLDLAMPGPDGFTVAGQIRAAGQAPILVVSGESAEEAKVRALGIGADDYLVKPFSMKELVARVRAAARRGVRVQDESRGDPIEIAELRIDPLNVQAYVNGRSAELTPTEFRLLYALALDRGRVVTRDEVLQKVWGRRQTHRDRTVDVFVRKLRDKIDSFQPKHTFIQTRYGVGYKLEAVRKQT